MDYFSEDLVIGMGKHAGVRDICMVVVQVVIIFGLETWVTTPRMGRALGIFQNRVDHCPTERHPRRLRVGRWEYSLLEEVMEEEI